MYEAGILGRWYLPLMAYLPGKTYTLHFDAGQLPPAEAFWSVTVYDRNGNLVPNSEGRYSVSSSRPAELVYEPDGSINIIFSRTDPADPNSTGWPYRSAGSARTCGCTSRIRPPRTVPGLRRRYGSPVSSESLRRWGTLRRWGDAQTL